MNSAMQSTARAEAELAAVARTQEAAHVVATAVWFPLLTGGIATLASPSVIDVIGGSAAPAWYWGIAGPAIGLACAAFYATRPVQLPVRIARASALVAVVMVASAMLLGALESDAAQTAAPMFAVAAGLTAFALLYRSGLGGVVAAAALVEGIVLAVSDSDRVQDVAVLGFGAVACGAAIVGILILERAGLRRL